MQNDLLAHNTKRIDIYLCPIYYNVFTIYLLNRYSVGATLIGFWFSNKNKSKIYLKINHIKTQYIIYVILNYVKHGITCIKYGVLHAVTVVYSGVYDRLFYYIHSIII